MTLHPTTRHTTLERGLFVEAGDGLAAVGHVGWADTPTQRAFALLALLGVVVALMVAPALIAGASLLDGHLLDRIPIWWLGTVAPYIDLGRLGTTLALVGMVSKAGEDE